jgi:hypothetical protein
MKKRTRVIVRVCVAVLIAILAWDFLATIHWDGDFDLPITIVGGGKPVDHTRIAAVGYTSAPLPGLDDSSMTPKFTQIIAEAKFDGDNYIARIPCSGRRSGLGFRNTYSQLRSILIRVELTDGRAVSVACPVSNRKHNPRIVLDIEALMGPPSAERGK